MKILITGATGFVGRHLCQRLKQDGHEVLALVRNPQKFTPLKDLAQPLWGDLESLNKPFPGDWISQLPPDLEAVIHTAGIVHSFGLADFYRINAEGTRLLCLRLANQYKNHSFHFLLISSLAAAGPSLPGQMRSEIDPPRPVGHYGKSKLEGEDYLLNLTPAHWRKTVIRPPIVIGPGDTAFLDVFKMLKHGQYVSPGLRGDSKQYSFICVLDLVDVVVKAVTTSSSLSPSQLIDLYFASYPQQVSYRQMMEAMGRTLGRKSLRKIIIPVRALQLLGLCLAQVNKFHHVNVRLTPDKLSEIKEDFWTCSSEKSRENLGISYQWDFQQTIDLTYEDYRHRGWL